jgi:WD40 repeat protein
VALWEALYGRRPFSGSSLAALSYAVIEGRFDPPSPDAGVPSWVNALLLRGLSPAPEKRWSSMRALLDALARDPEVRRRRALRVGSLVSVASLALAGVSWIAGTALAHNARQQYWNALTEQLLEIERERGLRQASDDALRARDATRMSVYRSYRPKNGVVDHEDPTTAAALLREVEGTARESEAWVSAANEILGQPIAKHVLVGHTDSVDALAFSPGAEHIYSGSADGTVRRWDLATGRSEVIILHESDVTDLALDPRGERVVTSSTDHTVRVWSPDGEPRVLAEHTDAVSTVAFSPDGRLVATSSADGSAKLIEIDSGRARIIDKQHGVLNKALFDARGERLLTVGYDMVARVWRVSDGQLLYELRGHEAPIFLGRFLPNDRVVTGSDDGTVRVWSLQEGTSAILMRHGGAVSALDVHDERVLAAWEDGSLMVGGPDGRVHELPPHTHNVYAASFDPSGARVLTASFDNTARSIAADGRGVPIVFRGNRASLYRHAVDASGRWYATGCYDGMIRIWDLAAPTLEMTLRGHTKGVYDVELDPKGERLATVGREGELRLWDARDGRALATFAGGNESLNATAFDPEGKRLATATRTGVVELWDIETKSMHALRGHESPVWDVAFDPHGQLLASASFDRTARVWDAFTGAERFVLRGHQDIVIGVEFEPGGKRLLTYSHDATIRLWRLSDGSLDTILSGHTAKIWMVTRSPDGHTLASASDDHTARIWPSDDPNASVELRSHEAPVWSVEFDPSGERVVTASYDGTARIWTLAGELVATLHGHAETVWSAQFAPGQRIITVSDDNTVRVWSLLPGTRTLVLSGHGSGVTGLALSPDGLRMYTGSADTTAKIWRLDRLDADVEHLDARLDVVTSFCLSTEQRMRELGEDVGQAQLAAKRCELAFAGSGQ